MSSNMKYPLFSKNVHIANYRDYRPTYSAQLYDHIIQYYFNTSNPSQEKVPLALDIGCGSGQATVDLSRYCDKVIGIDGSQNQLANPMQKDNIDYQCRNAEDLTFLSPNSVDLITVATALHWFNIEKFFIQVDRVLRPNGGVLCIWFYNNFNTFDNEEAQNVEQEFYLHLLDNTGWSDELKKLHYNYDLIMHLFPYERTRVKHVVNCEKEMSIKQYMKLVETWSACQLFKERNGEKECNHLLQQFANKLVYCYKSSNNKDDNDLYETKMLICWPVTLYLMKKI
ncbi:unnamed protein product [Didymodactylos carnosus]|uniref:Methyltransferase type 11 domain-containing protein n=1 Tax=Didymodactylos carnosus TaxID=1234261 RepID=A0A814MRU7_9BILA|nr:unnamed protein product [Didymodactylos carnosus]CAF3848854.1 unnamed protein product [Didymodactylos carnosus]